jgi:2,3-bisphosphoglycerate-independent phosphoglycerate mutase
LFRGPGLEGHVKDTDPQKTGVPPLPAVAQDARSEKTAQIANEFVKQATQLLAGQPKANGLTLRGFSGRPDLPDYDEVYGLKAAAIAVYPMYKGLARLVGMETVGQAQTLQEQMEVLKANWSKYDFFFIHFKYTDSTGEDGNFEAKVRRIEELDAIMPQITALEPTVLIVTGDHSTPSFLRSHSWHPVPTLLVSNCCRSDGLTEFNERSTLRGGLGQFEAKYLMSLALANAGRLGKYGA